MELPFVDDVLCSSLVSRARGCSARASGCAESASIYTDDDVSLSRPHHPCDDLLVLYSPYETISDSPGGSTLPRYSQQTAFKMATATNSTFYELYRSSSYVRSLVSEWMRVDTD